MSQKSSLAQPAQSVSRVLTPDTPPQKLYDQICRRCNGDVDWIENGCAGVRPAAWRTVSMPWLNTSTAIKPATNALRYKRRFEPVEANSDMAPSNTIEPDFWEYDRSPVEVYGQARG
jgi:hypothetical protein